MDEIGGAVHGVQNPQRLLKIKMSVALLLAHELNPGRDFVETLL